MLAREAEATSWSQRRKTYGGFGANKEVNPWIAPPSVGFPPVMPATHFRPLHVWGHPSVDQSLVHMWPKHVAPPPPWPLPHSVPPFPPGDPSFWHNQHQFVSLIYLFLHIINYTCNRSCSFFSLTLISMYIFICTYIGSSYRNALVSFAFAANGDNKILSCSNLDILTL